MSDRVAADRRARVVADACALFLRRVGHDEAADRLVLLPAPLIADLADTMNRAQLVQHYRRPSRVVPTTEAADRALMTMGYNLLKDLQAIARARGRRA